MWPFRGNQDDEYDSDDDTTATPTPDYDYTATFDYVYFSNTSGSSIDYSLYETIGQNKDAPNSGSINEASVIGLPCPVLFFVLAVQQIHRLL